jgi:hypothetical protein
MLAVLVSRSGKVLEPNRGERIDLLIEKSLYIVRAIDPEELARDAI